MCWRSRKLHSNYPDKLPCTPLTYGLNSQPVCRLRNVLSLAAKVDDFNPAVLAGMGGVGIFQ